MEMLRTIPVTSLPTAAQSETVDARGIIDNNGRYTRTWIMNWIGTSGTLTVTVSWLERGSDTHSVVFRTQR